MMIIIIIALLFATGVAVFHISKSEAKGKLDLLDEMWNNNDIDETIYKKYRF